MLLLLNIIIGVFVYVRDFRFELASGETYKQWQNLPLQIHARLATQSYLAADGVSKYIIHSFDNVGIRALSCASQIRPYIVR